MALAEFIRSHLERILAEWEAFAQTRRPAADDMDREALRNAAGALLGAIAEAIMTGDGGKGVSATSTGEGLGAAPGVAIEAEAHAAQRFGEGFTLDQMVSEYHALRSTVVRLWTEQLTGVDRDTLGELARFHEAIDRALACSIDQYTSKLEQARDLFLGVLGHDLRNPLGAILMSVQLLLLAEGLGGEFRAAAVRIQNSGQRMQRMIEDLLDFTRTRLGPGLQLLLEPIDLAELCREMINELKALHPQVKFEVKQVGAISGTWDGARIAQMVSNLIANAIEHSRPETPITVTVRGDGGEVWLSVHNAGSAIPPELQSTLYEPLMRAQGSPQRHTRSEGLGLGLYIARKIAKAHGGAIDVRSSAQAGTTFEVRLPRHVDPSSGVSGLT